MSDEEAPDEADLFFNESMQRLLKQRLPVIANVALLLFIVGFVLQALGGVFQPFLMAVLVYFVLKPAAIRINKITGMRMGWAYFFVVLMFVNAIVLVFLAVAWNVQSFAADDATRAIVIANYENMAAQLNGSGLVDVSKYNEPSTVFTPAMQASLVSSIASGLFATVTMVLFLAFIIYEVPLLEARIARAFPGGKSAAIVDVSRKIESSVNAYLLTKTNVSLGTGICTSLLCLLLGVPLWFVWGLLAFLFNYVPYIGSLIACAPPMILGFLAPGTIFFVYELTNPIISGLIVATVLTVNQQVWGSIIETKWTGNQLDVSPVLLLLTFAYGGFVWGIIGMILSAPVTVIIKIVFENIEPTRPIAILMQEKVRSLREIYTDALEDGSFDRAEELTIQRMVADLGIDEGMAYVIAARAAFDVAASAGKKKLHPNDVEMRMIGRAMDHLELDNEEREKILGFLDDGEIDAEEAAYLDNLFPDSHGEFKIDESLAA